MNNIALVDFTIAFLIFIDELNDSGGFSRSRWTIKQQIGKMILFYHILKENAVSFI
jgi:hypothetical protein